MKKKYIIIIVSILLLVGIGYYLYAKNATLATIPDNSLSNQAVPFPSGTTNKNVTQTSYKLSTTTSQAQTNLPTRAPIVVNQFTNITTNGTTNLGIDPNYKNTTAYQPNGKSLDATTDNYVDVPNHTIPMGSRVDIFDPVTQISIWGVVGDIGPYETISAHAAEQLNIWRLNMGMNTLPHKLEYKYYLNKDI